ncbi:MAG: hypothetical protein ACTHJY_22870, partial [Rhizobiaceae bacterium]
MTAPLNGWEPKKFPSGFKAGRQSCPLACPLATIRASDDGRDDAAGIRARGIHNDASAGNAGDAIPGN